MSPPGLRRSPTLTPDAGPHPCPALRRAGEGVARDTAFAAELLQHAADAGDPGAQGEVGWRAALGLRPSPDHLFVFGRPDVPRCPVCLK